VFLQNSAENFLLGEKISCSPALNLRPISVETPVGTVAIQVATPPIVEVVRVYAGYQQTALNA
jgi:hypothetical protein